MGAEIEDERMEAGAETHRAEHAKANPPQVPQEVLLKPLNALQREEETLTYRQRGGNRARSYLLMRSFHLVEKCSHRRNENDEKEGHFVLHHPVNDE